MPPKLNQPDVEKEKKENLDLIRKFGIELTTKTDPIEEVKKEWGELGYEVEEDSLTIQFTKKNKIIAIYKHNKEYDCTKNSIWRVSVTTFQEHQLLTKTFRALGWFDE